MGAVSDPTFADVIFHFDAEDELARQAYGHRVVLGRASEVFQAMVSGPLAVAAARADGRLHITLPHFVEAEPFAFLLIHIYTGATSEAGSSFDAAGQSYTAIGVCLQPPSFDGAQFVCAVLQ